MEEDLVYIPEAPQAAPAPEPVSKKLRARLVLSAALALILLSLLYVQYLRPPDAFPAGTMIMVEKGETLSGIANTLKSAQVIRSAFFFKAFLTLFAGSHGLVAGDYILNSKENLVRLAWKFATGGYDLKNVKITIPEGKSVKEVAAIFEANLYNFDDKAFLRLASTSEGYLFPDTYYFLPSAAAPEVFKVLRDTFDKKIQSLDAELSAFEKSGFAKLKKITRKDIITMASILEEEGRVMETRQTIAGILWKRLSLGMALQVDASVVYATGKKDGSELAQDDFKADSPYNTYLHAGLPPTPISNPGLDSIHAAATPIASKYFFYITDKKGGFYPAETYDRQLENISKYLNR